MNRIKSSDGLIHSGWVGALATIVGMILYKNISLLSNTFSYEVWIMLFMGVCVGLYTELRKRNGTNNPPPTIAGGK